MRTRLPARRRVTPERCAHDTFTPASPLPTKTAISHGSSSHSASLAIGVGNLDSSQSLVRS
jgi:hypothetical protein